MTDGFQMPPVAYPDGALDISACRDNLSKSGTGGIGAAHELLRAIETNPNPILIITAGSAEYERLLCRDGVFQITAGCWYHNTDKMHVGVLAARFPRMSEYLRTRTESYIAYMLYELQFTSSDSDRDYITAEIQRLREELAQGGF